MKTSIKTIATITVFLLITSFTIQDYNVEGMTVKFRGITDEEFVLGASFIGKGFSLPQNYREEEIYPAEGMKFVTFSAIFKNEGQKKCVFDIDDVFVSTEKDSLYRYYKILEKSQVTTIKPNKKITKTIVVELPKNAKPNELFIENKRYKIIEE